jgi:hypothetical protein
MSPIFLLADQKVLDYKLTAEISDRPIILDGHG